MRTPRYLAALATVVAFPALAAAQGTTSGAPLATALRNTEQRAARNIVAAAQDMPESAYGFKPTPAQMSFGQLMLHVAGANNFMCSSISGTKTPARPTAKPTTKSAMVQQLKASFDYCHSVLANVDDSKLGDQVRFFGKHTVSRATAMLSLGEDWGDHYGAAAIYMRLKGVLPPTARHGK